ncbi:hypothetical protein [Mycoplasmopsis cynos]|uniref:hypothetical protein n=1 Tax=Mycoplasmopsis cynos TaxID=171284 RepID=UPI0022008062|nr:hypothetical protein [Mycoplasmopsis cynos]UWV92378.1 hypothetical protein NWE57_05985 [Mycoplasmopsis cynos]
MYSLEENPTLLCNSGLLINVSNDKILFSFLERIDSYFLYKLKVASCSWIFCFEIHFNG